MLNIVTFETTALEPIALSPNLVPTVQVPTPRPANSWVRTLACKWDMIAVIALMAASAAYGIYALFFLTGF